VVIEENCIIGITMPRFSPSFVIIATLFCSCIQKNQHLNPRAKFTSIELSFTDGWAKAFSFYVDSNRVYIAPYRLDTAFYGLLPDSLYNTVDAAFTKAICDTNIKSYYESCQDCPALAVKILVAGHTIRINQTDRIDTLFNPVIESIQTFIDGGNHQFIRAALFFETDSLFSHIDR
jgi:hypothetical protein